MWQTERIKIDLDEIQYMEVFAVVYAETWGANTVKFWSRKIIVCLR